MMTQVAKIKDQGNRGQSKKQGERGKNGAVHSIFSNVRNCNIVFGANTGRKTDDMSGTF
jgi:hypothetical protein